MDFLGSARDSIDVCIGRYNLENVLKLNGWTGVNFSNKKYLNSLSSLDLGVGGVGCAYVQNSW